MVLRFPSDRKELKKFAKDLINYNISKKNMMKDLAEKFKERIQKYINN